MRSIEKDLADRSGSKCELCKSSEALSAYEVTPNSSESEHSEFSEDAEHSVCLCAVCKDQIESSELDEAHFVCLNDAMWSEHSAVKVLVYRLLNKLGRQDLIDMMFLDEDELKWALSAFDENVLRYVDANGVELFAGDSVVILKDLDVKGAGFVAKRGTVVKNIALVKDDETHIEGRVNGVKIHILTKYVKKM